MMVCTPHPASADVLPKASSLLFGDQDKEPHPLLAEYEQLYLRGLDNDAVEKTSMPELSSSSWDPLLRLLRRQ